jgi:hypothetical protein
MGRLEAPVKVPDVADARSAFAVGLAGYYGGRISGLGRDRVFRGGWFGVGLRVFFVNLVARFLLTGSGLEFPGLPGRSRFGTIFGFFGVRTLAPFALLVAFRGAGFRGVAVLLAAVFALQIVGLRGLAGGVGVRERRAIEVRGRLR